MKIVASLLGRRRFLESQQAFALGTLSNPACGWSSDLNLPQPSHTRCTCEAKCLAAMAACPPHPRHTRVPYGLSYTTCCPLPRRTPHARYQQRSTNQCLAHTSIPVLSICWAPCRVGTASAVARSSTAAAGGGLAADGPSQGSTLLLSHESSESDRTRTTESRGQSTCHTKLEPDRQFGADADADVEAGEANGGCDGAERASSANDSRYRIRASSSKSLVQVLGEGRLGGRRGLTVSWQVRGRGGAGSQELGQERACKFHTFRCASSPRNASYLHLQPRSRAMVLPAV